MGEEEEENSSFPLRREGERDKKTFLLSSPARDLQRREREERDRHFIVETPAMRSFSFSLLLCERVRGLRAELQSSPLSGVVS